MVSLNYVTDNSSSDCDDCVEISYDQFYASREEPVVEERDMIEEACAEFRQLMFPKLGIYKFDEFVYSPVKSDGEPFFELCTPPGLEYILKPGERMDLEMKIAFKFPNGYTGMVMGRSFTMNLHNVIVEVKMLPNNMKEELVLNVLNNGHLDFYIFPGIWIADLLVLKVANITDLTETSRL